MRKRVSKSVNVPKKNRPYIGIKVTLNYPRLQSANDWEFGAGPFPHYEFINPRRIHFYGETLPSGTRRIKVDAVVNSPGPDGDIVSTKWIK